MGKVKYHKRHNSTRESKRKEKLVSVSKQPSLIEKKELYKRFHQRRLAITPTDTSLLPKFSSLDRKKVSICLSTDKGQDNLHLPKQSKRAKKRMLARKKLAGAFGNMDSLGDALPAVEEKSKNRCSQDKPRLSKMKTKEIEMIKNIQWYHGAVQDPSFQADPWQACANYVNLLLRKEQKESS